MFITILIVWNDFPFLVLRMRSTDKSLEKDVGKFNVHIMQLLPKLSSRTLETSKLLSVSTDNDTFLGIPVQVSGCEIITLTFKHIFPDQ